jgi:hypothetical protein
MKFVNPTNIPTIVWLSIQILWLDLEIWWLERKLVVNVQRRGVEGCDVVVGPEEVAVMCPDGTVHRLRRGWVDRMLTPGG